MTTHTARLIAALRGPLERQTIGASGIEHLSRNPGCQRLQAMTYARVTPATLAARHHDDTAGQAQSVFALAHGTQFEAALFANNGDRFIQAWLAHLDMPDTTAVRFVDIASLGASDRDVMHAATIDLLEDWLTDPPDELLIIAHPALRLAFADQDYNVEPDAIVIMPGASTARLIEIKSYTDQGGYTNPARIRGALRQAAACWVALARHIGAEHVHDDVSLALRRPGTMSAAFHTMSVAAERADIQRLVDAGDDITAQLDRTVSAGGNLHDRDALASIPRAYCDSCREHCGLAKWCRREAWDERGRAIDPLIDQISSNLTPDQLAAVISGDSVAAHDDPLLLDIVELARRYDALNLD